jgi:F-type H+-transporting ATPase subunit epsilon
MATLRLEIVTPDSKTYSDDVDSVVLPGIEGELGIFPMHVPLMTQIAPGELRVMKAGHEDRLAVGEGFVEITQNSVSVLTDMAVLESEIDESATEDAIKRAEAAMKDEKLTGEDQALIEAALQKSLAKLRVKRRRHH